MKNNEAIYSIKESDFFGWKVKLNGNTCAQFPKLNLAVSYCQKILSKNKDMYKEINCTHKDGTNETIILFQD